jgi:hypothetical protein
MTYYPHKAWRMNDVLPGWFRLRNTKTGAHIDFNTNDVQHMALYEHYKKLSDWQREDVQPLTGDEPTEPITPAE